MICPKCGSENVNVQTASNVKSRGGTTPFWYWITGACLLDLALYCCIIGFFGVNIHHIFHKTTTKVETYAVCQTCGHKWKI